MVGLVGVSHSSELARGLAGSPARCQDRSTMSSAPHSGPAVPASSELLGRPAATRP
jgi:hypothetical protein